MNRFEHPSTRLRPRHSIPVGAWKAILGSMLLLILCGRPLTSTADDVPSATFDEANKLYEQGEFPAAIDAYQKLIEEDRVSSALYFNLGNAYFKSGQTGRAIVYYRLAQRLAPRDPDVRANLRFARESVAGGARQSRWERWLNLLSLNEITLVAAAAVWVWFLLLAAGQIRRDWARTLRPWQLWVGFGLAVGAVWLGLLVQTRFGASNVVVIAKEAVVRYGPLEEAQSSFTLRDGVELAVLDHKGQWLQVTDPSRRSGWLQAKDVFRLPQG